MEKDYETANVTRTEATKAQYRAVYARLLKLTEDEIYRHDFEPQQRLDEYLLAGDTPVLDDPPNESDRDAIVLVDHADLEHDPFDRTPTPTPDRQRPKSSGSAGVPRRRPVSVPRR